MVNVEDYYLFLYGGLREFPSSDEPSAAGFYDAVTGVLWGFSVLTQVRLWSP